MTRHLTRRNLRKTGGFSWLRLPPGDSGVVTYRLFRRDHRGVCHMHALQFPAIESRETIAKDVRRACHQLRNKVDEIDLAAMGVAA